VDIFRYALLGCGAGAIYGLLAVGLVIIHRGSGVINFAQGAMGMVGTFIFFDLWTKTGLPYGFAFALGAVTSGAIGAVVQLLIMRPLRRSPPVTKLIATLGILTLLEQGMLHHFPTDPQIVKSILPVGTGHVFGVLVGEDRLLLLGISIVITAALYLLYRYTQFGRKTAAAAENPDAAAALGISANRIALLNWVIGGTLAGVAGILISPVTSLSITESTLFVVPALAAALVGGLDSFPLALLGGIVIGILQSLAARYVTAPGWSDAAPFALVIVVLLLRPRRQKVRAQGSVRLPRLGSGQVKARTFLPVLVVFLLLAQFTSANWQDATATTAGIGLVILSLVVVTGYSGQLSLAQFSFAGYGAWVSGRLAQSTHMPFLLAAAIGVVAALPLGLILGALCVRTRGATLAIATLGLAVTLESVVFNNTTYTGGVNGTIVENPHIFGLDVNAIEFPNRYAIMCVIAFTLGGLVVANVRRGRSGRRLISVRANERGAASLGIGVRSAKISAFGIASMLSSLGGILLAFRTPNIVYSNFSTLTSINVVGNAVVGGVGWIGGAAIGGTFTVGSYGTQALNLLGNGVASWLPLIGAVLVLINLILAPDGVAYMNWVSHGKLRELLRFPRPAPAPIDLPAEAAGRVAPATLVVRDLRVHFGGVRAVDGVSLEVKSGEIVGLIGPNGAGKTTFIDGLTGFVQTTSGSVTLGDKAMNGLSTVQRARSGLARSFQSLELFDDMTVLDNLRAGSEKRDALAFATDLIYPRKERLSPATVAAIKEFHLENCLLRLPAELPYGLRRLIAIARAVSMQPSVLLLDEPAAGLDAEQRKELTRLIKRLASDWGMGIVLVEHDVGMVLDASDRVYVIDFGIPIASGTPDEITQNAAVKLAYLGVGDDDEQLDDLTITRDVSTY
jgi:sulfate-transporting ATPase